MSAKVTGHYQGRKKVELLHVDSGSKLLTDAAREQSGDGSKFSPVDLVAAAFGSCVMTTIAIVAERGGISVEGMHMAVEKQMTQDLRMIGSMSLELHLPESLQAHERQKLERAALGCPVHQSLNPEIRADIVFRYDVPVK
jgi:putative redox protein